MSIDNLGALGILAWAMLPTVKFDCKPDAPRGKVSDIGTNRKLLYEFGVLELSVSQPRPEFALNLGHIAAQSAGSFGKTLFSQHPLLHLLP